MTLSEEYFERALKVAPGGVHSPVRAFKSVTGTPVFFKSALGAKLFDVDGKEYIDFCQSFGPLLLGHRDFEISKVVRDTVELAWSFGACEPYSLELAEWIISKIPFVEKIRFVSSGTEAVMSALRVARAATRRNKILKFEGCYHGHVDSLLVKSGSGLAGESVSDSAGISTNQIHDTLTVPLDREDLVEEIFRKHGNEIAAMIIEPLPANYGLLIQRAEFINKICSLARAHGALVIFDEVISGFRVSLGGMAELLKITPDLVTYGKVIGAGFPVGAYGGRAELMNLVAPEGPVYQAGTLSANPIGMRAGLAQLKKIERDNIYDVLEERTSRFCAELAPTVGRIGMNIARQGSIFWIYSEPSEGGGIAGKRVIRTIEQIPGDHKKRFARFFHLALKEGLYLAPSGYEVSFMSFAHDKKILDQALEKLKKAAGQI